MEKILINDLSFAYPDEPNRLIIKDINLEIEQGEFVCLLGQSGCGKSTLLKLLAGLQKPSQGEITIDGDPIKGASLERTVVFQDYGLFPWMTAGENILLALQQKYPKQPKKELKNRAMEMLKQVGLDESVYKKLPKELSGGMKQRCAIARSLGVDAPILLMDEPFGALDAVTRAKLQDLILQLWSKEEVKKTEHTDGLKIVTYCSDVTPNYSCCRMVARDSWVKENKETVKLINEALIRAMCYFESHREDCVDLMVDQLNANKEYVEAYMLNEHYRINPDTVKNIVMDNYNYMMKVGGIENPDKSVNMEDRIYNKLYKEALDEAVEKWGDEDKDFYDNAVKFYQENNE